MALKNCPTCDEDYDVDEGVTTCPECGGPLEAVEDEDGGEENLEDGDGDWGED